jgi:hypothetical protein
MNTRLIATAIVVACLAWSSSAQAQAPATRDYLSHLTGVRPSSMPDGTIVISMDASAGDIRGLLSLTLAADGAGTWAFSANYVEDLRADGTAIDPADHVQHDHDNPATPAEQKEYTRFRRDGTITGTVSSVTLRRGPGGSIDGIESAELVITGGSRSFADATGTGRVGPWPSLPDVLTLYLSF